MLGFGTDTQYTSHENKGTQSHQQANHGLAPDLTARDIIMPREPAAWTGEMMKRRRAILIVNKDWPASR